jgi:hypothetical protein
MITTKTPTHTDRTGKKSKIQLEIVSPVIDDFSQNRYLYTIKDYSLNDDGSRTEISLVPRQVAFTYSDRDALKLQLIQGIDASNKTESEINKMLLPNALFLINSQNPVYGTTTDDWEYSN